MISYLYVSRFLRACISGYLYRTVQNLATFDIAGLALRLAFAPPSAIRLLGREGLSYELHRATYLAGVIHLHLNVAIAPEPEIGEISGKSARVGDVVEAHVESEKEPALLQHKSVTLPSTCDSQTIQENATMNNEAPSPRIDETALTKGQRRKLNALRKSVGDAIGEQAFVEWLAAKTSSEGSNDENAALIVDMLWPLVQQGKLAIPRGGYLIRRGRGRIIVERAKA